jgi:hypothetical protein
MWRIVSSDDIDLSEDARGRVDIRHYGVIADTTVIVRGRSKRRPVGGFRPLRSVLEISED